MSLARSPAVAGSFYPANPDELTQVIQRFLTENRHTGISPKAVISPHAGYIYSGPIAASIYSLLQNSQQTYRKIVLFGPAHRMAFSGLAVPAVDQFLTPLGAVDLDKSALQSLVDHQLAQYLDAAHEYEHCLEVQLPFLQTILPSFLLTPILVGVCEPSVVADAIELLWGDDDTLIVISSDLSHYHSYREAKALDQKATLAIENLQDHLNHDLACGSTAINGLLQVARQHQLNVTTIDTRNSGDTAGPRDQVVGYGAYAFSR